MLFKNLSKENLVQDSNIIENLIRESDLENQFNTLYEIVLYDNFFMSIWFKS